jgi:hypothetical protein
MSGHYRIGIGLLLVIFLLAGCGLVPGLDTLATPSGGGNTGGAPAASSLLPNLAGYTRFEAQRLQDYIVGLGQAGSALLGQFQALGAITVIDRVADCYQNQGVVAGSGYARTDLPIVAGFVAIANRDRLLNPQTFLACIGLAQQQGAMAEGQGGGGLTPCAFSYSTQLSGSTFDILYAGTDVEICQAFCRSLPGCTGH